MITQEITLISYGHFERKILSRIADSVAKEYLFNVVIVENHLDMSEFYDPARRQYNGNELLKNIDSNFQSGSIKVIGLFSVDLFIPILTYIFGQAFLHGRAGIASVFRLRNELYGIKQDEELLISRFEKVVIHELGHTFGLKHCHNTSCVMVGSTYVEDIDQKSKGLCPKCREEAGIAFLQ